MSGSTHNTDHQWYNGVLWVNRDTQASPDWSDMTSEDAKQNKNVRWTLAGRETGGVRRMGEGEGRGEDGFGLVYLSPVGGRELFTRKRRIEKKKIHI